MNHIEGHIPSPEDFYIEVLEDTQRLYQESIGTKIVTVFGRRVERETPVDVLKQRVSFHGETTADQGRTIPLIRVIYQKPDTNPVSYVYPIKNDSPLLDAAFGENALNSEELEKIGQMVHTRPAIAEQVARGLLERFPPPPRIDLG